jgi:hypothetical protein
VASCVVDWMFDDMIAKPKPRRWQTAVIVGSALAHGAVFAGVAIAAMWKIEKLEVGDTVDITYKVPPPQGASAPPPAESLKVTKVTKVVKVKPPVVVQPTIVKDPDPVTTTATTATTTTGTNTGGPGGDGNDPDADPNSTGKCTTPGACIIGSDGDPPDDDDDDDIVVVKKPPIVQPSVAKGLRYAGNDQIHPPETVRVDMMHQDKDHLRTTVQLCVDEDCKV